MYYKVGRDIPAGVFDFHHVWGNGRIHVYKAEETILGNLTFGDNIGDTYEYEKINIRHTESNVADIYKLILDFLLVYLTGGLIIFYLYLYDDFTKSSGVIAGTSEFSKSLTLQVIM